MLWYFMCCLHHLLLRCVTYISVKVSTGWGLRQHKQETSLKYFQTVHFTRMYFGNFSLGVNILSYCRKIHPQPLWKILMNRKIKDNSNNNNNNNTYILIIEFRAFRIILPSVKLVWLGRFAYTSCTYRIAYSGRFFGRWHSYLWVSACHCCRLLA